MSDSKRDNKSKLPLGVDKLDDPILLHPEKKALLLSFLKEMTGLTFKLVKETDPKDQVVKEKIVTDYVTAEKYFPTEATYKATELHTGHFIQLDLVTREVKALLDAQKYVPKEFRYEIPKCNIHLIETCTPAQKEELFTLAIKNRIAVEAANREREAQVRADFKKK
jgi:hypothetical protein